MQLNRRDLLKMAICGRAASWLLGYRALAAPFTKMVKITAIKTLGLDNLGDGSLVRIETDAGLIGYGESGTGSQIARGHIDSMKSMLIGQDPLALSAIST
jgi:hypothetical protein